MLAEARCRGSIVFSVDRNRELIELCYYWLDAHANLAASPTAQCVRED
jgi:hypothetical protein